MSSAATKRRCRQVQAAAADPRPQDDICAIEGIHAVGLKSDYDYDFDDPEQVRKLSIQKAPPLTDPRKK